MIDPEKTYWTITGEDIIGVAKMDGLPTDLSDEELRVFENCLVEGFSSDWDIVAKTAIQEATQDRPKAKPTLPLFDSGDPKLAEEASEMFGEIGGAASRLARFIEIGNTDVLLEGLDKPNLGPCAECDEHGVDLDHTGADGRSVCDDCRDRLDP